MVFDRIHEWSAEIYFEGSRIVDLNRFKREKKDEYMEMLPEIEEIMRETTHFHGTGALQYEFEDNKYCGDQIGIRDNLGDIISEGLVPQIDYYNLIFNTGSVTTTSMTKLQPYSRCYANLFMNEDQDLEYKNGSSVFWGKFVGMQFVLNEFFSFQERDRSDIEKLTEEEIREIKTQKKIMKKNWTKSFRKDGKFEGISYFKILDAKSDIDENFGVVIGLSDSTFSKLPNRYVAITRFEARTPDSIDPNKFTHIQVPYRNISTTKEKLSKASLDVPVIPIEFVEIYNSRKPFFEIVK